MLTDKQQEEFASLRVEIIDLNVLCYFFVKKVNRLGFLMKETTREYVLEELVALRYMENGLILHLTNLDDDSSDFSFWEASKELHRTFKDQKQLKVLFKSLKDYRRHINTLKVKHRNKRIAHLNNDKDLGFDEFLIFGNALKPLILEANTIADEMWGKPIEIKFKLGSMEGLIDFREAINDLAIDLHKIDGFN